MSYNLKILGNTQITFRKYTSRNVYNGIADLVHNPKFSLGLTKIPKNPKHTAAYKQLFFA